MNTSIPSFNVRELLNSGLQQGHKQSTRLASIKNNNSDSVSIGLLTPEKTQTILNRQLAEKLEQRLQAEGIQLEGLNPNDFTPEKVSERILGFVSGRVLSETEQDKQTELMQQARKGIEQGFAEARDILASLDVLNGKVKEDVDSTYDLIQQGLERLQQQIDGTLIAAEENNNESAMTGVQQASMAHSFSRNENTRVEITTQDGDTVRIELYKQQDGQLLRQLSQSEDRVSYSQLRSLSASAGISYQLQGELDEDEQKAIDKLLKDVAKASDSFFSGNVQQAFKKVAQLDFDSEEFSRFTVNFDYRETRQVAVSTYSQYQSQSGAQEQDDQSAIKDFSQFVKQLDRLFENPFAGQKFAHPEQGIAELFNGVNHLLHSQEIKQMERASGSLLDSLIRQIKQNHSEPSVVSDSKQA